MTRIATQRGFTLLETLVAVTLLALLFGALMPVFQHGLTALRVADRHGRAVLLAQSLLERESVPGAGALEPGDGGQGGEGDYRWSVTREPWAPDDEGPEVAGDASLRLVHVAVTVTWPGNDVGLRLAGLVLENAR